MKRRRGAYLKEKVVGFRILPEKYEALRRESWQLRRPISQLINEALDVKFGWHPSLFEKSGKPESGE
jgi:hypothetical protein